MSCQVSVRRETPNLQTEYVTVCCLVLGTDEYGPTVEWKLEGENRRDFEQNLFQRIFVHDESPLMK